jgi:hypothetical protein
MTGPDAEHRQIEVDANAGLTSGLAAVQPGSQHPLTGERGGEFGQQRFSELFNRDHGTRSYRLPPRAARATARDGGPPSGAGGTVKKVPDSFIAGLFAGKGLGGMAGSRYTCVQWKREEIAMHRVVVDEAMSRQLGQAASVTEICDADGNVIGIFRPRRVPQDLLDSDEGPRHELIREGRLRTGRPLADVIADLERRS